MKEKILKSIEKFHTLERGGKKAVCDLRVEAVPYNTGWLLQYFFTYGMMKKDDYGEDIITMDKYRKQRVYFEKKEEAEEIRDYIKGLHKNYFNSNRQTPIYNNPLSNK